MTASQTWADDDVPRPLSSVKTALLDSEAVLYDMASGRALLLNTTAALVWAALGELTVGDVAKLLADEHEVDAGRMRDDLQRVLTELETAGVLGRA